MRAGEKNIEHAVLCCKMQQLLSFGGAARVTCGRRATDFINLELLARLASEEQQEVFNNCGLTSVSKGFGLCKVIVEAW